MSIKIPPMQFNEYPYIPLAKYDIKDKKSLKKQLFDKNFKNFTFSISV